MPKKLLDYCRDGGLVVIDQRRSLPTNPGVPWGRRTQKKVTLFVVHHTGGWPQATAKQLAFYHISRGWPGIAYTFYIRTTGIVDFCHEIKQWGPHAAPTNAYSLGIALAGNYVSAPPSEYMITALDDLISSLRQWYHDSGWVIPSVQPHNAFARTACPGQVWAAYRSYDYDHRH
jgi:hypothetical protein